MRDDGTSVEYVTQAQFGQVLTLLGELRTERANAAKSEIGAVCERLDRIADTQDALVKEQQRLAKHQEDANSKTATLQGVVRMLPCRDQVARAAAATAALPCEPEPSGVELTASGVRVNWRPTKRHVAIGGAALTGLVSWPALGWLWQVVQVLAQWVRP